MSMRSISRVPSALALFVAFAAWGRDVSIESVNRGSSGDIESITLGFTAADEPSPYSLRNAGTAPGSTLHQGSAAFAA